MSQRLDDLRRMLGESRARLGALADRLAAVGARLGSGASARPPAGGDAPSHAEAPLGTTDIESLDLKFEAIGVEGSVPEKLPEG
jgi:hypothetical protein